jgi:hypothetical protein
MKTILAVLCFAILPMIAFQAYAEEIPPESVYEGDWYLSKEHSNPTAYGWFVPGKPGGPDYTTMVYRFDKEKCSVSFSDGLYEESRLEYKKDRGEWYVRCHTLGFLVFHPNGVLEEVDLNHKSLNMLSFTRK